MDADRLLSTFLDLVRIDSPSREERRLAEHIGGILEGAGCSVRVDGSASATGSDTGNLIAELPGELPFTLVLSAHMDNVEPCRGVEPAVVDGRVVTLGETVLGGDDKVGIAATIELMRVLADSDVPKPTIRAVFTVMEEVGLHGAKNLAPEDVTCDLCVVLDSDGPPGTVVVGAPFHHTFKAAFVGAASHAGVAPEQGVSAISMASLAISRMELGRLDAHTTANIGTISGGSADNVVAARCVVTGECRSLDSTRVSEVHEMLERCMQGAADELGGKVETEWTVEYDGFHRSDDDELVGMIREATERCGFTHRTLLSGGGSDANILSGKGVPVLVLGTGMTGFHTTDESLAVRDLEDLTTWLFAIVDEVSDTVSTR